MNIYEKLLSIQSKLKAPKEQLNKFGNYNYRSCEDILEAVKPFCKDDAAVLFLSDEIVSMNERIYVKATATLLNTEKPDEKIVVTAFAREEETKKGMDGSQITGASSSYARKYALNGLFDIDDARDSDTTNTGEDKQSKPQEDKQSKPQSAPKQSKQEEIKDLYTIASQYTFKSGKNIGKKLCEVDENTLKYFMTVENQTMAKYATAVWEHDFKDISKELEENLQAETPSLSDDEYPF